MKYLKVNFDITGNNGNVIADDVLMQAAQDILCSLSVDAGFESFEQGDGRVTGYVRKEVFDKEALDCCIAEFPLDDIHITYTEDEAEDKNWNKVWEDGGFEPVFINNRCIIHDTVNLPPTAGKRLVDITIDAEQAFGTGTHETTYMIVNELTELCLDNKSVLDCGCGTGVLSVAASKFGAERITAYDIDDWSVRNTVHNCELNDVENVSVMLGDASVLNGIHGCFDIVIANINRNILIADMPLFRKKMVAGGTLILSGFYDSDINVLVEKGKSLNLECIKETRLHGWAMLILHSLS